MIVRHSDMNETLNKVRRWAYVAPKAANPSYYAHLAEAMAALSTAIGESK